MRPAISFGYATFAAFAFCFLTGLVVLYKPSSEAVTSVKYENCNNCKIEQKEEKDFIGTLRSDPTAAFTALLFIATVVLAGVTIGLYLEARETGMKQVASAEAAARHAERSAKAAEQALTAAEVSSERQLRAYVGISWVGAINTGDGGLPTRIKIEVKNFGQTPAFRELALFAWLPKDDHRSDASPDNVRADGRPNFSTLHPGGVFEMFYENDVGVGMMNSVIIGRIDYIDAFEKKRWVNVRMISRETMPGNFRFDTWGNDSN